MGKKRRQSSMRERWRSRAPGARGPRSRISAEGPEAADGGVSLTSADLELVTEDSVQTVGMRFTGLSIPQGATILNAHVQFQADETSSVATSLAIRGEDTDDARTFSDTVNDVSSRPGTAASVPWEPVAWTTRGEAGPDQRTPNLAAVIQEIVDRPGWAEGNSLALVVTGSGVRTAESYDGDPAAAPLLHVEYVLDDAPAVVGRHVFYNNSAWDGNDPAPNAADDGAIAPHPSILDPTDPIYPNGDPKPLGKEALLPGETATFRNYTSYSKGLNGIMVDVAGLPGTPMQSDFVFRVGNTADPSTWADAPAPQSITARPGAGTDGSDRITLVWADDDPYTPQREPGSTSKQWLQVTVLDTAATGLPAPDVFYFGNAIGESGNSAQETNVDPNDEIGARNHPHSLLRPAPVEDAYDFDRDKKVDTNDEIIARNNSSSVFSRLVLLTAPTSLQGGEVPVAAAAEMSLLPGSLDASRRAGSPEISPSAETADVSSPAESPLAASPAVSPAESPLAESPAVSPAAPRPVDQTAPVVRTGRAALHDAALADLSRRETPARSFNFGPALWWLGDLEGPRGSQDSPGSRAPTRPALEKLLPTLYWERAAG